MTRSDSGSAAARSITRLVGIYDADGGLAGETRYVVGHLLGRRECALCDITHGRIRRRREFDDLRARVGVPFAIVHRNERTPEVAAETRDALPCVIAEVGGAFVTLLDRSALVACGGDVDSFERALRTAVTEHDLCLPGG